MKKEGPSWGKLPVWLVVLTFSSSLSGQATYSLSNFPAPLQFYARTSGDTATVPISGSIGAGYERLTLVITKDKQGWKSLKTALNYQNGKAGFSFSPSVEAGLFLYGFQLYAVHGNDSLLMAQRDSVVCGDAYVIDGQSNARVASGKETYYSVFARTFGRSTDNFNSDPSTLADTLWSIARPNGPSNVGVWGLYLMRQIIENNKVPVCLINGGVTQSRIKQHMRNTLDPLYYTNTYYGRLYYRVFKARLSNSVKAIFWYQGESDASFGYPLYQTYFSQLHGFWAQDYPAKKKVYLFQINIGCNDNNLSGKFRDWQRNIHQTYSDIQCLATFGAPGFDGCHYSDDGYYWIGQLAYAQVARDFYAGPVLKEFYSPDVIKAYYTTFSKREITVEFGGAAQITLDGTQESIAGDFFLDGVGGRVLRACASGNKVKLLLDSSRKVATLTYLPDSVPQGSVFTGPYIRNSQGFGAFSFYGLPIGAADSAHVDSVCPPESQHCGGQVKLAPNPSDEATVLSFCSDADSDEAFIRLYDLSGREVFSLQRSASLGWNKLDLSTGGLLQGMYVAKVILPQGHAHGTVKLNVVR
jgi:hypothetical protein